MLTQIADLVITSAWPCYGNPLWWRQRNVLTYLVLLTCS